MTLWSPIGVFMPGSRPVQPDLLVVLASDFGIIDDRRVEGVPALLVEILSPSNADYDRVVKLAAYARAGVPEFWLVRPEERDVLIYSKPEQASGQHLQVTHVPPDGELVSPTLPFRATIADFFTDAADEAR
jgi:Uma2 family endonuclease